MTHVDKGGKGTEHVWKENGKNAGKQDTGCITGMQPKCMAAYQLAALVSVLRDFPYPVGCHASAQWPMSCCNTAVTLQRGKPKPASADVIDYKFQVSTFGNDAPPIWVL